MVLPVAITGGVTGHNAHHIELHEWFNAQGNVLNVMDADYGAIDGGSAVTNTTALNAARAEIVTSGKPGVILIPAGVDLPVTPGGVLGGSNVTYAGGGTLSTTQTTNGYLITFPAGSSRCAVDGLRFASPNDNIVAVLGADVDYLSVTNCRADQCRLVLTGAALYVDNTDANSTTNVTVADNVCVYTGSPVTGSACIWMYYVIGGNVRGNRIVGYNQGIVAWGGNANPDDDGALANARKTRNISVTANVVTGCGGGGIWFSMCKNSSISGGNVVSDCGDVGMDLEGCTGCDITGNTARNNVGGNYTTFFNNRGVVISGNVGIWDTAGVMARIQNLHSIPNNKDVTLVGNTFYSATGVSVISCEVVERLVIKDNTLTNCRIDTQFNNQLITTITDNTLLFSVASAAAFNAVNCGQNHTGGRVNIKGNEIISTVAQPANSRAIRVLQDDPNYNVVNHIDDNECIGFGTGPIQFLSQGANVGWTSWVTIRRNNMGTSPAAAVITDTGALAAVVLSSGNYYDNTTAAP